MATKSERYKALADKQAKIRAQMRAMTARDASQTRKDDTRRKILLGGWMLSLLKKKHNNKIDVLVYADMCFADTLKADRDRELFGLPPLAAPAALSPPPPEQ